MIFIEILPEPHYVFFFRYRQIAKSNRLYYLISKTLLSKVQSLLNERKPVVDLPTDIIISIQILNYNQINFTIYCFIRLLIKAVF